MRGGQLCLHPSAIRSMIQEQIEYYFRFAHYIRVLVLTLQQQVFLYFTSLSDRDHRWLCCLSEVLKICAEISIYASTWTSKGLVECV